MIEEIACAKINLGLHVLRKRADGFHDIDTVFLEIPWSDRLTFELQDDLELQCSDPDLPTDDSNLCMKAASALRDVSGSSLGALISLEKCIPYGAGLGGGSSDAAATLRGLSRLWSLDLDQGLIREMALGLGSDVPFFLGGRPARGTGRGEELTEMPASYRFSHALAVVVPPVHVSTPIAYSLIHPRSADRPDLVALVSSNDPGVWAEQLQNDFQEPVFASFPLVEAAHDLVVSAGALYASLSGSGGAVFGVFSSIEQARSAAEAAEAKGWATWSGHASNGL